VNEEITIYVINLDRSTERMERIAADLGAVCLPFHRIPAVDGASLLPRVEEYDALSNERHYLAPLSRGEIACVLSHREVWRRMAGEQGPAAAVVLEDDAKLTADARDLAGLVRMLAEAPEPELVKLYNLTPPRPPSESRRRSRPLLPALTTTAQALNRSAAATLLAFTEKFHEPADVIIQRWWDHGVRVTSLAPPMFFEIGHDEESTIRTRGNRPPEGRLLRELRRPVWQARRLLAAITARVGRTRYGADPNNTVSERRSGGRQR